MNWKPTYELLRDSAKKFAHAKGPRLGASLAFYTALSLAPMLLFIIVIASEVFGDQAAQGQLKHHLVDTIGDDGAQAIEDMLANTKKKGGSTLSTIIGIVTLVFGATGVFAQMQDALNTIWEAKEDDSEGLGLLQMAKDRLMSLSVVCGMAFLLLVSTVFSAVITGAGHYLNSALPMGEMWANLLNLSLSVLLTTVMFAMIFKVLPKVKVRWADVWVGAAVTAVLFNVGKSLISFYLGSAAVKSSYGAAGSFMALLIWVYYSAQILLFGAAFTQVYSQRFGSPGAPGEPPAPKLP